MSDTSILALHPSFTVDIVAPLRLPASLTAIVEQVWTEEKRRLGVALTNGRAHSLLEYGPNRLVLAPIEYKLVLARSRRPDLVPLGLAIRPLAVTGVLSCGAGLVFGCRAKDVALEAGMWEPVPAGGLSQPDPLTQILDELAEEIGLQASQVAIPEPCGLVEEHISGTVDIVYRIQTNARTADILHAHRTRATNEYAQLSIVAIENLASFLEANRRSLLPTFRSVLELAGYAPPHG